MDQDRTYDRVAENHFQALLRSGRDALDAVRDMENAAAFLAAEGQLELAQALREIASNTARQKLSQGHQRRARRTRHLIDLEPRPVLTGAG